MVEQSSFKPHAHWPHVAQIWDQVTPPLRPSAEDLSVYQKIIDACTHRPEPLRVLVLGVTPEIYRLNWPPATALHAVDRSPDMIKHVWPGPATSVTCDDWCSMSLPPRSFDLTICDGGLALLRYPEDQAALARKLSEIVVSGGKCVFRLFCTDGDSASVEEIFSELRQHKVPDLSTLKLRLWAALQSSMRAGMPVHDVWSVVAEFANDDLGRFAEEQGWPIENVLALAQHKNSHARYYLSGVREIQEIFVSATKAFRIAEAYQRDNAVGALCPIVVLDRL